MARELQRLAAVLARRSRMALAHGAAARASRRPTPPLAFPGRRRLGRRHARRPRRPHHSASRRSPAKAAARCARRSRPTAPRIIVFEVGGVIDLDLQTLRITSPYVTIAGQTAPSPGITLIRGGIDVRDARRDPATHPRAARRGRAKPRAAAGARTRFSTQAGAHDVIVDHCTFTWATDENLSASGPRFTGATPDEWRAGTSHRITFSHNIIAEGLANSTHPKFEHSKGSLIHDNVTDISDLRQSLRAQLRAQPAVQGRRARRRSSTTSSTTPARARVHYNLQPLEWGAVPFAERPHDGGRQRAARRAVHARGHRVHDDRRRRRSRLSRPRQHRGRSARPAAADVRPLHDHAPRASSSTPSRSTGRQGSRHCPPSTSRPGCSRTPARGRGTATRTTCGSSPTSPKAAARSSTARPRSAAIRRVAPDAARVRPGALGPRDDDAALAGRPRQ